MGVYLANLQQPLPSKEKLCEFYFPFGKKKHSSQLNQPKHQYTFEPVGEKSRLISSDRPIFLNCLTGGPRLSGPRLSGSSQYRDFFSAFFLDLQSKSFLNYREKIGKKFDYRDFSRKIPIIEVNKCSVVNLKIQLSGFFEIFGHPCPDNRGPPVFVIFAYFDLDTLMISHDLSPSSLFTKIFTL